MSTIFALVAIVIMVLMVLMPVVKKLIKKKKNDGCIDQLISRLIK